MPKLIVESGPDKGKSFTILNEGVIGRRSSNSISIKDPNTSRKHAKVYREGDGYYVRDLGSSNGTYCNDMNILKRKLRIGDRIRVGSTVFKFVGDDMGIGVGDTIAGYTLMEKIGAGGMGTVFKARQNSMDRLVALKVLNTSSISDAKFVERFIYEARAAGKLNHPNVIQVHDVGQEGELHFFSMEYVDGRTLREILQEKTQLPMDRILEIVLNVCHALDYAHQNGIVHRDVKPDNIMVSREGDVKLADLGIAKTMQEASSSTNAEGRTVFGTPHYMAPEQALGRSVDGRADIYSLGATFYHALTGSLPYTGKTITEVIRKHVTEKLQPIQSLNPDVPNAICQIVETMMAKEPGKRYQSPRDVIEEIDRVRSGKRLKAQPLDPGDSSVLGGFSDREKEILRQGGGQAKVLLYKKQLTSGVKGALMLALVVLVLIAAALGTKKLADHFLSPDKLPQVSREGLPDKPGPAAPDRQSVEAGKYGAARMLEKSGDLDSAEAAYREIIRDFPASPYAGQALIQIDAIQQKRGQARDRTAELELDALKTKLGAMSSSPAKKELILAFIREYEGTGVMDQAQALLEKAEREIAQIAYGRRKENVIKEIALARRLGVEGRIAQAVAHVQEKVLAVYQEEPFVKQANQAIEELTKLGDRRFSDLRNNVQVKVRISDYDGAVALIEGAQQIMGQGQWFDQAETLKTEILDDGKRRFAGMLQTSTTALLDFDYDAAKRALREYEAWHGVVLEVAQDYQAQNRRIDTLENLHQLVVQRIQEKPGRKTKFAIGKLGSVVIVGATEDGIEMRFAGGDAGTVSRWRDLSQAEVLNVYRLYLDMRKTRNKQGVQELEALFRG